MPHPTPAQIIYGSVTVVTTTFALLLIAPALSGPGLALVAGVALLLGVLVALVLRARHTGRVPAARPLKTAQPQPVDTPRRRPGVTV
ncbi:hypothetical protein E1265_24430 [Streptomyces sp. 8K308]|uniref:hypothetical protein n=1 Tax=Streptomyces sp. 8K308 TaxID=2530388 RepID=UPI00104370EF|nr:hypothetical protein [Streptomyces sp. 8K308]TDC19104.1 hypothetical protein E1265_24430 [Streptomyces sp. 8K308]